MLLFTLSQKSVTRALQRASWATQQQFLQLHPTIYIVTLYTPGYLKISWDVFAKKSADILSCRNSFITISTENAIFHGCCTKVSFATYEGNQLSYFQNGYFFKILWWFQEAHYWVKRKWKNKYVYPVWIKMISLRNLFWNNPSGPW